MEKKVNDMEKYGTESRALIDGLRQEESDLMMQMADYMSTPMEKKGEIDRDALDRRLAEVRNKITEMDLKSPDQQ